VSVNLRSQGLRESTGNADSRHSDVVVKVPEPELTHGLSADRFAAK